MDILEYINRMNRLYGTEPLAPWDKPEVPRWDEAKAPPRYNTMRLLTGGRVEMKPGGIVEPGVTHYAKRTLEPWLLKKLKAVASAPLYPCLPGPDCTS